MLCGVEWKAGYEWWISEHVEWSRHGVLFEGVIPEFAWRDWGKLWNPQVILSSDGDSNRGPPKYVAGV